MMLQLNDDKTREETDPISEIIRARAVLAPMSGITDMPFRMMARRFGCAFAFTEMIDTNGIAYGNRKSFKLMERFPEDSPLGAQIVGQDIDKLLYAAQICEEKGFKVLDLNAGCPARKVIKAGKGAALLLDPAKIAKIVHRLAKSLKIPVTIKIRSGWNDDNLNYMEIAKTAAASGASAICVHARTKDQMYRGKADHAVTRAVKNAVDVPVFASGNVFGPQDAIDILKGTGCDAVFVARGALGRPWIFREINSFLSGKTLSSIPTFQDIKNIVIDHFSLCFSFYGDAMAKRIMHKHLSWYLKRYKNLDKIMKEYRKIDEGFESFRVFVNSLALDGSQFLAALDSPSNLLTRAGSLLLTTSP